MMRSFDLLPSPRAAVGRGRGWGVSPLAPLAESLLRRAPPPRPLPTTRFARGGRGEGSVIAFCQTSGGLSRLRGRACPRLDRGVGWGRATGGAAADRRIPLRHIRVRALRRGPGAVGGGFAAGAAIPGIVRRRLQPGARTEPGIAAVDRGIEQFRQSLSDRLHVGAAGLGAARPAWGLLRFRLVGGFGHRSPIWVESPGDGRVRGAAAVARRGSELARKHIPCLYRAIVVGPGGNHAIN
jgi:hypothetical protein